MDLIQTTALGSGDDVAIDDRRRELHVRQDEELDIPQPCYVHCNDAYLDAQFHNSTEICDDNSIFQKFWSNCRDCCKDNNCTQALGPPFDQYLALCDEDAPSVVESVVTSTRTFKNLDGVATTSMMTTFTTTFTQEGPYASVSSTTTGSAERAASSSTPGASSTSGSPTLVPATGTPSPSTSAEGNSTSPGTIAGAAVGSIAGVGALIAAAFFLYRRRKQGQRPPGDQQQQELPGEPTPEEKAQLHSDHVRPELANTQLAELSVEATASEMSAIEYHELPGQRFDRNEGGGAGTPGYVVGNGR